MFYIFTGLKHCGKTSLGRAAASELHYSFFDLDQLVLDLSPNKWKSVRELWMNSGREEFLRLEELAAQNFIRLTLPSLEGRGVILSLGGGSIENDGALHWLRGPGLRVYIRAEANLLFQRIMAKGRPPFLSEDAPEKDFSVLYQKRDKLYRKFADIIHDVDNSPREINTQRLLKTLEAYHAGK
ncbi:MAG: hypothetical protein B0D92_04230 [Spirochaeta sp. LUC14_002_19_P3]|nr:MAG: hypothetical protein B0D92_04230 [Spirochaeta sp. LUC14_002_19_P3]